MIRSTVRRAVAALLLVALAASLSVAGSARADDATPDAHAGHHAGATPAPTDACATPVGATPTPVMGMTGSPMAGMDMSQEFDLVFIDMMISHHRAAIAMAEVVLTRASHDVGLPPLRQEGLDLAQAIVTTQQAEIDQLTAWREAWYPGAAAMPMDQMGQMMEGIMQGMPGMMGTPGAGIGDMGDMGGMMGMMDASGMVQSLCNASGHFEEAFLRLMIPHHQSAVMMAQAALTHATHAEIKELAQAIVETQQREIAQMEGWLEAWYGATPAASTGSIATDVAVTLSEFAVSSGTSTFRVGQSYRFVVTNAGAAAPRVHDRAEDGRDGADGHGGAGCRRPRDDPGRGSGAGDDADRGGDLPAAGRGRRLGARVRGRGALRRRHGVADRRDG